MKKAALSGAKVLELCNLVAGPCCARLLADLGANVTKIESPGVGDEARRTGPFLNDVPHPERSGLFLFLNANKSGITLDINKAKGREIFRELIRDADILVEDNKPGLMSTYGLGYEDLEKLNPRIVVVSITPFGQTGPYKDYSAYPINSFHSGGEGYLTPAGNPYPDRPPLKIGRFAGEYESGVLAALGTLIAFSWQKLTGLGQHVDLSKQESLMTLSVLDLMHYPTTGFVSTRTTRTIPIAGNMPCSDGYLELDMHEEVQWQRLAALMGNPEWTQTDKYKQRELRHEHAQEIDTHLREWTQQWTKQELYHAAQQHGIPAAAYFTPDEIANSPQLKTRDYFVEFEHASAGRLTYPSVPYRLSDTPHRVVRPAPMLGEHNAEVYEKLGYGKQDLVRLRGQDVI